MRNAPPTMGFDASLVYVVFEAVGGELEVVVREGIRLSNPRAIAD
jgi:hypothetical protein